MTRRWFSTLGLAALLFACGSPTDPQGSPTPTPTPSASATPTPPGGGPSGVPADFSLADVNTNSLSFGRGVSPRQYLDRASAWYFGHST